MLSAGHSTQPLSLLPMEPRATQRETVAAGVCLVQAAREAANQGTFQSRRRLVRLLRSEDPAGPTHRWGDFTLGGGLGMLALACELGWPALLRRCLACGCRMEWRDWIVAWRKEQVEVISILQNSFGIQQRPWLDTGLERRLLEHQAQQLQAQLEKRTAQAEGAGQAGRL